MLTEVEKLTHHFGVHVFIILHIQFCQSKLNVKIADFLLLSIRMCVCWGKMVYEADRGDVWDDKDRMFQLWGHSDLKIYSSTHWHPLPLSIPRVQVLGLSRDQGARCTFCC